MSRHRYVGALGSADRRCVNPCCTGRHLPKDVEVLVKANAESQKRRFHAANTLSVTLDALGTYGNVDRITLAEVLEGAAQRLRSETEAEKQAERQQLRSAHVNGKVKP